MDLALQLFGRYQVVLGQLAILVRCRSSRRMADHTTWEEKVVETKYDGCTKAAAEIAKIGLALMVGLVIMMWPKGKRAGR